MAQISVFDVLGLAEADLEDYSIRLNSSFLDWDVSAVYYTNLPALLEHAHKVQWKGHDRRNIHTRKVLQFIQLSPRSRSEWLFIGASLIRDTERENDEGDKVAEYEMIPEFDKFAGRLIARYTRPPGKSGAGALTNNLSKEQIRKDFVKRMVVDRIAQSPIAAQPFPGFEQVRLTHPQLVAAVSNDEWRAALDSVSAVYLQTDRSNGWHYVGSAYSRRGENYGLLSRWTKYASGDFTGGNLQLKKLVQREGSEYISKNFEYTILEIFDRRATSNDIINREHWWMDTLHSVYSETSPFGYNSQREQDRDQ